MQNTYRDATKGSRATRTDDRADRMLPVTAEVGSEGGSYADPTNQVATFGTLLAQSNACAGGSVAGDAMRSEEIAGGGSGTYPDPAGGMIRYPTEDPRESAGPRDIAPPGPNWRAGLIGAAAGFAGAALLGGLTRRRR